MKLIFTNDHSFKHYNNIYLHNFSSINQYLLKQMYNRISTFTIKSKRKIIFHYGSKMFSNKLLKLKPIS